MSGAQATGNDYPLAHTADHAAAELLTKRIIVGFGFWIFLLSDIIMFSAFFAAYAVLVNQTAGGPSGRDLFHLPYVALETAFLLLSSFTCGFASIGAWKRSLSFGWKASPKGFDWTLHSALGFWTLAFFAMWAVSGIYLSIPNQFNALVDFLEPLKTSGRTLRFGDQVLFWMAQSHFGRFAGIPVKIAWTVLGLTPAALFVTGALMWWKRVLKPWLGRKEVLQAQPRDVEVARP